MLRGLRTNRIPSLPLPAPVHLLSPSLSLTHTHSLSLSLSLRIHSLYSIVLRTAPADSTEWEFARILERLYPSELRLPEPEPTSYHLLSVIRNMAGPLLFLRRQFFSLQFSSRLLYFLLFLCWLVQRWFAIPWKSIGVFADNRQTKYSRYWNFIARVILQIVVSITPERNNDPTNAATRSFHRIWAKLKIVSTNLRTFGERTTGYLCRQLGRPMCHLYRSETYTICVSIAHSVISRWFRELGHLLPLKTCQPVGKLPRWRQSLNVCYILGLASRLEIGQSQFVSLEPRTTIGVENRKTFRNWKKLGRSNCRVKRLCPESMRVTQYTIFQVIESVQLFKYETVRDFESRRKQAETKVERSTIFLNGPVRCMEVGTLRSRSFERKLVFVG